MNKIEKQIENLRTLQESYDALSRGGTPEQQAARVQLAQAITSKGVPTAEDAPMQTMADNVRAISHGSVTIDGGEMYSRQLFGGLPADSPLWNLYDVLAQMKTKYLGQYAGLIVCEYYKGYDSLQLQGADAYYTCDGDEYDYDTLHVWHDADNGRANRWICFLFRSETAEFNIVNTDISPRSMYVGGHIGTIKYFVAGRLTELVSGITEDDIVDEFDPGNNVNAFGKNFVLKGVKKALIRAIAKNSNNIICDMESEMSDGTEFGGQLINANSVVGYVSLPNIRAFEMYIGNQRFRGNTALRELHMPNLVKWETFHGEFLDDSTVLELIEVGAFDTNLAVTRSWKPTAVLSTPEGVAKINDNIRKYIAEKVSDRTGQTALTFTVSTNLYNNLEQATIDAFTAKNWNVLGA